MDDGNIRDRAKKAAEKVFDERDDVANLPAMVDFALAFYEQERPDLAGIGRAIKTQDNRITNLPVFVVEQKRFIWGMDTDEADPENIKWLHNDGEYSEVESDKADELESKFGETYDEPEGYVRRAFVQVWEFVTACFTEQGCKDYLAVNGHNLREPRVYVYSAYRNAEWETIRTALINSTEATT